MAKKITAILLSLIVAFSFAGISASAESSEKDNAALYNMVDGAINAIAGGLASIIKGPKWEKLENYVTENFYPGMSKAQFLASPENDSTWSVGYANASIQTGDELDGKHYVGGSLSVTKKLVTDVRDDQKVRTVALSDGRGITIFATLDAYGLANTDVREIRARFQKYADENDLDITAVNVSTLHQHSCVDTFGMNGDIVSALFTSCIKNILGLPLASGQNKEFMENLYNVTVDSMKTAVANMEEGTLSYGTVDAADFIRDKRDPQVYEPNITRIRFVPDNAASKETWLVNAAIHCVGNGAAGTVVTGDYPYFMEKYINETAGANFFYIQGAELAITSTDKNDVLVNDAAIEAEYGDRYAGLVAYGTKLGELTCSITEETSISPILNIAMKEFVIPIDNNILVLAAKCGLLVNDVVKTGLGKYAIVTEMGYMELGNELAVTIIPGELAPEIAYGGADTAAESWDGNEWEFDSFSSKVAGKKLLVFGLTNDQVGYILTDNNWHSILTENEEIVSAGRQTGGIVANNMLNLIKEYTLAPIA